MNFAERINALDFEPELLKLSTFLAYRIDCMSVYNAGIVGNLNYSNTVKEFYRIDPSLREQLSEVVTKRRKDTILKIYVGNTTIQ